MADDDVVEERQFLDGTRCRKPTTYTSPSEGADPFREQRVKQYS